MKYFNLSFNANDATMHPILLDDAVPVSSYCSLVNSIYTLCSCLNYVNLRLLAKRLRIRVPAPRSRTTLSLKSAELFIIARR